MTYIYCYVYRVFYSTTVYLLYNTAYLGIQLMLNKSYTYKSCGQDKDMSRMARSHTLYKKSGTSYALSVMSDRKIEPTLGENPWGEREPMSIERRKAVYTS